MYSHARLKLTFLYSILFLSLFWLLSLGLYFWMSMSLSNGYIAKIRARNQQLPPSQELDLTNTTVAIVAGSVALDQLKDILLFLNCGAALLVPLTGWYLTGITLGPIQASSLQQRRFVSDASHELRTPLSIVSGEIELALTKTRSTQDYKSVLISTKEEVDRLAKLVENLLFLARNDYIRQSIELKPIDITDLLNSVITQFSSHLKQKKLTLNFSPPATSLSVIGQPSLLQMLFSNLIDNAIKYTPPSGRIKIKIVRTRQFVTVSVTDSGIGINSRDLPQIFNRFYRSDASRSSPKGFGLGLAIVKTIVDKHRGKIQVESSPRHGSSFIVSLPLSTPPSHRFLRPYLHLSPTRLSVSSHP